MNLKKGQHAIAWMLGTSIGLVCGTAFFGFTHILTNILFVVLNLGVSYIFLAVSWKDTVGGNSNL